MNVLLLGSGGREHAFAYKLSQSKKLNKLYISPGNAGTLLHGENVELNLADNNEVKQFCIEQNIQLLLVGPEAPLVDGIIDFFNADAALQNIKLIGPVQASAMLEGSKDFAKAFMQRHSIPTARYQTFTVSQLNEAYAYLEQLQAPYVLKADGLAAGKGVLILHELEEAKKELAEMLSGKFGKAGKQVVIEEFLSGIELSVFVLTDGESYKILPEAKDYKRIGDGDTGLNTGGMGAVSPVPFADAAFLQKVENKIVKPTIAGLKKDKLPYKGFVFIGLMNVKGEPFVIEYNVRMGDPETEVVMPRIQSDLLDLLVAVADGKLHDFTLDISTDTAVTVMLVSGGYPGDFEKGKSIAGLDEVEGVLVFHAGTTVHNNTVKTAGGRVMAVTARGKSIEQCREKIYTEINKICYDGIYYRKDIGLDLLKN